MGWLIALGTVVLLLAILYIAKLKLTVSVSNESSETALYIFGKKIKLEKTQKSTRGEKKKPEKKDKPDANKNIETVKTLLRPIINAAKRIKRKLVIASLKLKIAVATDDAAKTAISFGTISAAAGMLCGFLKFNFKVKAEEINIYPDFSRESYLFDFGATLYLRILDIILVGAVLGVDYLKARRKSKKKQKSLKNN